MLTKIELEYVFLYLQILFILLIPIMFVIFLIYLIYKRPKKYKYERENNIGYI